MTKTHTTHKIHNTTEAIDTDEEAQEQMAINPKHYKQDIECIDAMVAAFGWKQVKIFCKINAFKYLWRADNKNGSEDIKKAAWYTRFATGDDPR